MVRQQTANLRRVEAKSLKQGCVQQQLIFIAFAALNFRCTSQPLSLRVRMDRAYFDSSENDHGQNPPTNARRNAVTMKRFEIEVVSTQALSANVVPSYFTPF